MTSKTFMLEEWVVPQIQNSQTISSFYNKLTPHKIQLALMENPFPWPDDIKNTWLTEIENIEINRYPLVDQIEAKERIKAVYPIPDGFNLLLGNGSNELIQNILRAFADKDRCILSPNPSYFLYDLLAEKMHYEVALVDLKNNFELDLPTMLKTIEEKNPVITFISYPNNPSSNCFKEADIDTLIRKCRGIIVIDEAYFPYSRKTFLNKIENYDNVLLLRSFSKVGLAAIRLGYLIGPTSIIDYIDKIQLPFSINTLSLATAKFILNHFDVLSEQVNVLTKERAQLDSRLKGIGANVLPSDSNYLVFKLPNVNSDTITDYCLANNILISNLNKVHPLLQNYCRVAIGKPQDNATFLESIERLKIKTE